MTMIAIQHIACRYVQRWVAEEDGATAIEYAIIIGVVSVAIGFVVPEIQVSIDDLFLRVASGLSDSLP